MAGNIRLEVVTPQKEVVKEEAQIVVAPGVLGEFGVLIGHTPFMTALNVGTIRYTDAQGQENSLFVSGGFAEALPDKVTVLAESAERSQDIDVDRAKAAMERAQKRLEDKAADIDYLRAEMALKRALHRIQLAESRHF
jgi:F-type H+-transporting ATPase subunit epsilon